MYVCDKFTEVCNTVRERDCSRGGPVTCSSVTGTGPGAACKPPKEPLPLPPAPPPLICKTIVNSFNRMNYRVPTNNITTKVC